jgi:hypothetical protein
VVVTVAPEVNGEITFKKSAGTRWATKFPEQLIGRDTRDHRFAGVKEGAVGMFEL